MRDSGLRTANVSVSTHRKGVIVTTVIWGELTELEANVLAAHAEDAITRMLRVMEVERQEKDGQP